MEIHPPEHPIHTWRDFAMHIATIVVGLLIAIGLEQTVELMHHRYELRETHEALQRELDANKQAMAFNTQALRNNATALRNNLIVLAYLKEHPGTPVAKLPGILVWPNFYTPFSQIAWRSAQTANITELMPRDEVFSHSGLYEMMDSTNHIGEQCWDSLIKASRFNFRDPDPTHFSPAELDNEINLVEDALTSKYSLGVALAGLSHAYPELGPGPSWQELNAFSIASPDSPDTEKEMAEATRITRQRLAATPAPKW